MNLIVRKDGKKWSAYEQNDKEILKKSELIEYLKSLSYDVLSDENELVISNVPSEANVCELVHKFYGGKEDVCPF